MGTRRFSESSGLVSSDCIFEWTNGDQASSVVRVMGGDHADEMVKICESLLAAREYAENETQARVIDHYVESFKTGSLEAFRESQKAWVSDKSPIVENILGFVEHTETPMGSEKFVESSTSFIRLLPWAVPGVNDGKGPFEKDLFEAPDFTSLHALALCSSLFNDIREKHGFKNVVIANRLSANNNPASPCHYVHESEVKVFKHAPIYYQGSSQRLCTRFLVMEVRALINPPDEKIASTVEERRATLVPPYLIDSKALLSILGCDDATEITADDRQ
ncbi:hypothetical protein ACJZ2D_004058 [Fusarium nematophilum]